VEVTPTFSYYCLNCSNNVTERKVAMVSSVGDELFYMYYLGLLGLLTLVNVIGNSVVISSILRHRQLRVPGNYFLFSIACSDLMLGLLYPIYNVSHIDLPHIQRVLGKFTF
jgi:muscarinic acetylcholine receptor M2